MFRVLLLSSICCFLNYANGNGVFTSPLYNVSRSPGFEIKVGTPPQTIYCNYLDVDYYGMVIVDGFDPTKSHTAVNIGTETDFTYYRDTVYVAGIPLYSYAFEIYTPANGAKSKMRHGNCNLFMGRNINGTMDSPMKEMQSHLDAPIMNYFIHDFAADQMGLITFGGVDTKNCGAYKWYNTIGGQTDWNARFTGASVLGQRFYDQGYGSIYMSDGTHVLPGDVRQKLVDSNPNIVWAPLWQLYAIPCNMTSSLPPVTFYIENDPYTLEGPDYLDDKGNNLCVINIDDQGELPFIYTIQWRLMRNWCIAVNYKTSQIGLAHVKKN